MPKFVTAMEVKVSGAWRPVGASCDDLDEAQVKAMVAAGQALEAMHAAHKGIVAVPDEVDPGDLADFVTTLALKKGDGWIPAGTPVSEIEWEPGALAQSFRLRYVAPRVAKASAPMVAAPAQTITNEQAPDASSDAAVTAATNAIPSKADLGLMKKLELIDIAERLGIESAGKPRDTLINEIDAARTK